MESVYLLLGSNKGDSRLLLDKAVGHISNIAIGEVVISHIYKSEPWGFDQDANWFLNQAVKIDTNLTPEKLLDYLMEVEKSLGRERSHVFCGYQSREMDIDIIFFGNKVVESVKLQIPHPKLKQRRFVLLPLNEIASEFVHPVIGKPVSLLLEECSDKSEVNLL
ncbi:MAG: 2-amino-4-hydroxy-6-hydroxymethyldihydropteridine diphosphokinase [Bacteroidia bacterium]|nr:2-amino-4-hydroxy-6-hydroxymethyldihydropteridine diphosphokinase [Bacteroidales bacterium]MDD3299660.1 2-amino-4-hydroxy-6-hydroxymethyldihydropteridine diphosphokinase [Bacteroidales bacterium]MDD3843616.1 2-amino-4-hydroxy-6-hydroxymethyldihydropteridine diphosphokinase [Bacteroidales bacterium]MDD4618510.1 2-amino-4-hydroxy-6-hydroxymethyldihydropteridine diphosphokinase [Bacteroidales bacterium]NCC45878.1 2-amino-4-hydroxy-6-hydroxymethyldihydropteridine diphosphokinase [Bacteroidia bac